MMQAQTAEEALREAAQSWRDYSEGQGPRMLVLLAVLAGLVALLVLYGVLSGRQRVEGKKTFLDLARASGLKDRETKFFMELARRLRPDNPSILFVRRSLFESAVADGGGDGPLVDAVRRKVYSA